jgi:hypothetical protein
MGGGFGLVGMRERVTSLGGTLAVGPTVDGGFEVRATLPLGEAHWSEPNNEPDLDPRGPADEEPLNDPSGVS